LIGAAKLLCSRHHRSAFSGTLSRRAGLRIFFVIMRFIQDSFTGNSIRAYSDGEVTINDRTISQSVVITPDSIRLWEPRSIDELTTQHIERLCELEPEIVIIGTGRQLSFPPPALTAALQVRGIGVEVMAHGAACRTFNILLAEDRRVVAALMMEPSTVQEHRPWRDSGNNK
jgi:uncharacterized protein